MKKRKRKWFSNPLSRAPLLVQILLLFIGSVVLPISLQNIVFSYYMQKNSETEMINRMTSALDENAQEYEAQFSNVIKLAREYNRQEWLHVCLNRIYSKQIEFYQTYEEKLRSLIEDNVPYYPQIKNTTIYTTNSTVFEGKYVTRIELVSPDPENENLKEKNMSLDDLMNELKLEDDTIYNLKEESNTTDLFYLRLAREKKMRTQSLDRSLSLFFPLNYYTKYKNYRHFMRLDFNLNSLRSLLMKNDFFENVFLTDRDGRIIFDNTGKDMYGTFKYYSPSQVEDGKVVLTKQVGKYPFYLYAEYNSDIFKGELNKSLRQSFPITILTALIGLFITIVIMGNVRKRLKILMNQSQQIAEENFTINMDTGNGKDEISTLEKSMNKMSSRLKDLIENEYQAQMKQAQMEQETTKAKLLALQSQVNPHFMFNALETIRLRALDKGEKETAKIILYMSRMFRNLITWDNNIITLEEEISFLNEFLHIQEYRFEDEFSYDLEIDDKALKCRLPKMVIQQLAENACIHGVEAISSDRWVGVLAEIREDKLVIIVEDNGGGINPEKLSQIKESFKNGENSEKSVGLYNIYNRLALYYGEDFTFDIESQLGMGTKCTIMIPVKYEEE